MRRSGYLLVLGIGFAMGASAHAGPPEIGEVLKSAEAQRDLLEISKAPETLNKAELLFLGMRSNVARNRIIREAENYIFVSVPFWYDDEEGNATVDLLQAQVKAHANLDLRVVIDWGSAAAVGDFFAKGIAKRIRQVTSGKLQRWDRPLAKRTHSFDPVQNRMHDKFIVVDGKKVLLGGMNIGDEYMNGGLTEGGWHDTDVLLEGPAAQETSKIFLKAYELTKYLDGPGHYPPGQKERTLAMQNLFYKDEPEASFLIMDPLYGTHGHMSRQVRVNATIPVRHYFTDERYFPTLPACPECKTPVRLIYDNSLVDRVVKGDPWYQGRLGLKTGEHFSKTMTAFSYLAELTKRSIRMYTPYLTVYDTFISELAALSRRGIEVSLITNSVETNEMARVPYIAGVGHYRKLLEAGVRLYEWQGHVKLKELTRIHGCKIEPGTWPGATIHTKVAIFDEQVLMLGSHNFDERSVRYNNELTALINDPGLSSAMNEIFSHEIDSSWRPKLPCAGDINIEWPAQVELITIETLNGKLRKYERQAAFFMKLQRLF